MSKGLAYFQQVYDEVPGWVQKMHDYSPVVLDHYTGLRGEIMQDGALSRKEKDVLLASMNAARLYPRSMGYNAIRPNVIGRKNWMHSVSEAGARANAICLSPAETAKSNGIDFYEYLKKLLIDLPNLDIHQNPEILDQYLPWSKMIQTTCSKP